MTKLNKYLSDSYENFFDNDLSTTDQELYNSISSNCNAPLPAEVTIVV